MPVIFGNKDAADMWLSSSPSSNIDMLLKPYEESDLVIFLNNQSLGRKECCELDLSKKKSVVNSTSSKTLSSLQAWYSVTPAMGKTSFDGPECIKEVLIALLFSIHFML